MIFFAYLEENELSESRKLSNSVHHLAHALDYLSVGRLITVPEESLEITEREEATDGTGNENVAVGGIGREGEDNGVKSGAGTGAVNSKHNTQSYTLKIDRRKVNLTAIGFEEVLSYYIGSFSCYFLFFIC